jgi:hypothetical protein
MICSSLNRDCLIVRLLTGYGPYSNLEENQGLRSNSGDQINTVEIRLPADPDLAADFCQ